MYESLVESPVLRSLEPSDDPIMTEVHRTSTQKLTMLHLQTSFTEVYALRFLQICPPFTIFTPIFLHSRTALRPGSVPFVQRAPRIPLSNKPYLCIGPINHLPDIKASRTWAVLLRSKPLPAFLCTSAVTTQSWAADIKAKRSQD